MSHCWSSCSSMPSTPSPFPVARSSSQSTNMSSVSTASSARTVLAALNKIVTNNRGDLDLPGEEFDIAEDLERSMEMFNGLIKAKDDEIEVLNTKVLELEKDLEFQDEKDKDFQILHKLAEEEADTVNALEKENMKLMESINELEKQMNEDKLKMRSMEDTVSKERVKVWEQLNSTVAEVDSQKKKYQDLQNLLTEARDDIIKLEEENARLKDQVSHTNIIAKYYYAQYFIAT